ncbi:gasdermin D like 1 isoform X2 [Rattus norvegicus]|uniref:Gasdermin domain containing protein RGD1359449 n=2 Tax=Rattus norvegicus TaxID=10116 RepID=Q6AY10_RAT|nr:gasdermin D like 1 [Rattus norvegicus]XP_006241704.1 gasdermin domain containing protein RGD1359449 isoform X1 [Rattus norvegicus]XP_038935092.1 gasdermin domain containing protein RGD1359449 isoform X1 [Rattus norvegicus]XP_038935093.1 gasdermin domain containing protein RGD1359449 isoform X1 [Rattus norvegicus]XP_038935094.1 gasdermin domain containing protein RGD1359449 isoform X1 [Rattus norvegicus]XP_038935095.1 gasdermin domain containing protein RGD1359449 isoform X1 [Rattus norvegic|eukprot:NP_001014106.1 gasdermin domain containing protein RGD1359449 [Rattus norvegicus]
MSSLFLRSTKSLVRELGRKGELVPVDSLNSSQRLRPFCLVRKKHKHSLWPWDTPLIPTDFSLLDVLEPGCPDPEVNHSKPIYSWEKEAEGLTGAVSVSAGLQSQVTGSGTTTCLSALAVQTLWVSPFTWEMLLEKRKLRSPRPSFLQELQSRKERESLYVVTEAVETLQDTILQSHDQMRGAGQLSLLQLGHVQVQGQSHVDTEKMVSIPQGSVLAYRVLQLVVEEDGWAVLYFPERKLCRNARVAIAFSQESGEESNFYSLRDQADSQLQDLVTLSSERRATLLGALQELLRDQQALQELEDTLEQALDTGLLAQLEGPGGCVLCILQDSTSNLSCSKGRAILYILGALAALSEPQHCLLAQSIERQILSEELELAQELCKSICDMLTRVLLLYGGKVRPQGEVALQGNTGQAVLPCVSCIGLLRSICHMTKQNKLLRFQPIVPMTIQCQSMGSSQLNK